MAGGFGKSQVLGIIIGAPLMAAAIFAVAFIDWQPEPEPEPLPVRPLKTMVIETAFASGARNYPGKVRASQTVDLAFQVAGQLIELPVLKGREPVEEGQLLARLDPRDYESALQAKEGVLAKAQSDYEKLQSLFEEGNAGRQELVDAKAAFEVAESEARIARKALEDTTLRAPFAGMVANTFVENFQNVLSKQRILSLQDVSSVEIEVSVPETRVIEAKRKKGKYRHVATFDYLPGREFEVEAKEYSAEADPLTQTYTATFVMPAPQNVLILPGMTSTIREFRIEDADDEELGFAVPIDAVAVDGLGQYYVWLVQESGGGSMTVHRKDVSVGEMVEDEIAVTEGLSRGDRIATAGVHVLQEGQQVKLMESRRADSQS